MQKLMHFTVGNDLDDLARQGYWFEDRKEWAKDLIKNLCCGISNKQITDVLNGDADVIAIENGTRTSLVYEENKEFKLKLKNHLEFLEEKKKDKIKAKRQMDFCGDDYRYCKFNMSNKCCFGLRNGYGCFFDNPKIMDEMLQTGMNMRLNALGSGVGHAVDLVDDMTIKKIFDFVFRGHHYTIKDSARNQSECPHCSYNSKGDIFKPDTDKKAFIGVHKISDKQYIYCFECPKCFNKFFYHNSRNWR